MKRGKIFVSYARVDSDFALKLTKHLRNEGIDLWLDQLEIKPGSPWDNTVEEALNSAEKVLLILSPASVNSRNVKDEISFALENDKLLIPILFKECTPSLRIGRLNHIDFRNNYSQALEMLLQALVGPGNAKHNADSINRKSTLSDPLIKKRNVAQKAPLSLTSLQYKDSSFLQNFEIIAQFELSIPQSHECILFCYFFFGSDPIEIIFEGDEDASILCGQCTFNPILVTPDYKFAFSVPRDLIYDSQTKLQYVKDNLKVGFRLYQKDRGPNLLAETELYSIYGS